LIRIRSALLALVGLSPSLVIDAALAQGPARPAAPRAAAPRPIPAGAIQAIRVEGNQRIEEGTIRSYMLLRAGDAFDADRADRSLKALFATGLFQDVRLDRVDDTLVVRVVENPIVNRIAFEGNRKLTDANLRPEMTLRPRGVFTTAAVQADRQRILDLYAAKGRYAARVEPKIIRLDQNRVDVVFEINDGDPTLISRIAFVGNKNFSERKLTEIINTREQAWWRFLSTSDLYDPERVNFDKELLRRYYLKNGYADFQVVDTTAELAPDKSSFFVTYTLNEGDRYRVDKVTLNVKLRNVTAEDIQDEVGIDAGDWYDGDAVERTTDALAEAVRKRGQPFVDVKPRIARNRENKTVELIFDVLEGPRVYVERIDIVGNTRTMDKVIRREITVAEGDPFNAAALRRSRQRLQDLGFFEQGTGVNMTPSPGSTPDKVVITTEVRERPTGEFTIGGGYSTDAGFLVDVGLKERNFLGMGIDAGVNGVLAQRRSSLALNVTDPYFLDRNLTAGLSVFYVQTNNQDIAQYQERRIGFTNSLGYEFNEHLRQVWTYSLISREVFNIGQNASIYIRQMAGKSVISQIGQTLTLDYRDSKLTPRSGWVISLGGDLAGLGGDERYARLKVDAKAYIPLDRFTGTQDWGLAFAAGAGYLFNFGRQELIIDRFFLGGENLRGFELGGAGPHAIPQSDANGRFISGPDSLGGRLIATGTAELRFPLPIPGDLGLSGRAFVDVGVLTQASFINRICPGPAGPAACPPVSDNGLPRVGAGVGVSWQTPFGLINLDLAPFVIKHQFDRTQIFRFGFGTRF
jgi:outer membrane protein insertion porin family